MKFEILIAEHFVLVYTKLNDMSSNPEQHELPDFSIQSSWNVRKKENCFELYNSYPLFDLKGTSQSSYIANVCLCEGYAVVEVKLKAFSRIVLIGTSILVTFLFLHAVLNGSSLGLVVVVFPIFYFYSIAKEQKAFVISIRDFLTELTY